MLAIENLHSLDRPALDSPGGGFAGSSNLFATLAHPGTHSLVMLCDDIGPVDILES